MFLPFMKLDFAIQSDRSETGVKKCIRFSNLSRQLWIKISAQERFFEWKESIERTMKTYPGSIIQFKLKTLYYCAYNLQMYKTFTLTHKTCVSRRRRFHHLQRT